MEAAVLVTHLLGYRNTQVFQYFGTLILRILRSGTLTRYADAELRLLGTYTPYSGLLTMTAGPVPRRQNC